MLLVKVLFLLAAVDMVAMIFGVSSLQQLKIISLYNDNFQTIDTLKKIAMDECIGTCIE